MSWQQTLKKALGELQQEERRLASELSAVQEKIQKLSNMSTSSGAAPARGRPRTKAKAKAKRKLSAEGRAAISRAAKKRWAKHRAEQRKKTASKRAESS